MIRLYRAIVQRLIMEPLHIHRPMINYFSSLYPVHNRAIHLCTAASLSSPVQSLYVESWELPLSSRRMQLLMQYYSHIELLSRGRVDDLSFFDCSSPFCFLSIGFHFTFSISYKILPYLIYYYCI